jgi:hypothetical protein
MIMAYFKEAEMGRGARVNRTSERKLEIVLEGLKSGNIAEACPRYEIAPNLYYRWKDEALQRWKTKRTGAFDSWSVRWDTRRWRLKS